MQQLSHRIFLSGGMHVDVSAAARRRAEREKAVQEAKDTLGRDRLDRGGGEGPASRGCSIFRA